MIASRSHSWSASSRYCVVRKTVVPRSLIRRTSSQTVSRLAGIEAGRRLVEEQHLGLVHERGGEVEPALHAAGVALDAAVGGVLELDERRAAPPRARAASRGGQAEQPRPAGPAARARSGAGRARPPAARRRSGGARRRARAATSTPATRAVPEVIDSSVVSIRTVVDLPAPFGPEEAEDLAGLDPQVDAADRLDRRRSA